MKPKKLYFWNKLLVSLIVSDRFSHDNVTPSKSFVNNICKTNQIN